MKNFIQNLFKKKEASDAPAPQINQSENTKGKTDFLSKIKSKFGSGLKNRLGKKAVQGLSLIHISAPTRPY